VRKFLTELIHRLEVRSSGKWFLLSLLIGVVAGLGAIAFHLCTQVMMHSTLYQLAGYAPGEPAGEHTLFEHAAGGLVPWRIVAVMTVGGLVSGLLVYTFAPEAEGHGTDAAIDAFHNKRGDIAPRIPLIKTLASAITLGTGGSGGREGPIAQIGAGFGSFLGQRLKLSARDRRIMLAAGMGAGVGAIFRAPLAGALFAGEILYRDADMESDVIVPAGMSSIVAYSVYCLSLPHAQWFSPLFGRELHYALSSPLELIPYTLLAFVLVAVGVLYIQAFYGTHHLFRQLPIKRHFRPAVGAALAGMVGLVLYFVMGRNEKTLAVLATGYGALQDALNPTASGSPQPLAIKLLVAIALVKIVTTSLTIGSGGSGGVFGPSMVIGGCLGAAVGQTLHAYWPIPGTVSHPQAYAIVGMAGFFAGCAHAPFSTIIMVSEMTGDYGLLLPTMWVSMLCFLLCRRWTLYVKQVPTRLQSAAHRGDFLIDVLEGIKVRDVYRTGRKLILVPEAMSLDEIVHTLAKTTQQYFPVVDANNRLVGIFSADDVRTWLYNETIWQLAVARDVMISKIVSVTPDDDLNTALERFTQLNLDELPVLDPDDPGQFLGMLRRKETIAAYNRRLMEHKQRVAEAG
jgi:chloride channel protein, CIC family